MSLLTKILTHQQDAKDRLLEQFKNLPNIEGILDALVEQIQLLENNYDTLCTERTLDNSVGAQLDGIGQIVGQVRIPGQSDADYLIRIKTRIVQNISEGEAESIIQVYKTLVGATIVLLIEAHPAALFLNADVLIADQTTINELFKEIKTVMAAGVRLEGLIGVDTFADSFAFSGVLEGKGFGDDADPLVGGKLPEFYTDKSEEFAFSGNDPKGGGFSAVEDPLIGGILTT